MAPNVGEIRSSIDVGLMFFSELDAFVLYSFFPLLNVSMVSAFHNTVVCIFPGGVSSRQLSSAYIVLLETIGPNYVH